MKKFTIEITFQLQVFSAFVVTFATSLFPATRPMLWIVPINKIDKKARKFLWHPDSRAQVDPVHWISTFSVYPTLLRKWAALFIQSRNFKLCSFVLAYLTTLRFPPPETPLCDTDTHRTSLIFILIDTKSNHYHQIPTFATKLIMMTHHYDIAMIITINPLVGLS